MSPAEVRNLEEHLRELRGQGRYEQARDEASRLLEIFGAGGARHFWNRRETECALCALDRAVQLPARERSELAWADRISGEIDIAYAEARMAEGSALAERQLEIRLRLLPPDHPDTARSRADLGTFRLAQGAFREAEELLRSALASLTAQLGEGCPGVREIQNSLASVLHAKGDRDGAEPLFRAALQGLGRSARDRSLSAGIMNNLAVIRQARGDYIGAEALCREALKRWKKVVGEIHPHVATTQDNLAQILERKGDLDGAETLYRDSLAMKRTFLVPPHPLIYTGLSNLAVVLQESKDPRLYTEAEECFRQALDEARSLHGSNHPFVATCLNNLAVLLLRRGRLEEAESAEQESITVVRLLQGPEHEDFARGLRNLASIRRAQNRLEEGEELCRLAIEKQRRVLGEAHPELARSYGELGRLRWARGDLAGARAAFLEQAEVYEQARVHAGVGFERATFQRSPYNSIALVLLRMGRGLEAWEVSERARGRSLAEAMGVGGSGAMGGVGEEGMRSIGPKATCLAGAEATGGAGEEGMRFAGPAPGDSLPLMDGEPNSARGEVRTEPPVVKLERLQQLLGSDAAMVGWVPSDPELPGSMGWGYVIRAEGPVTWVELPEFGAGSGESDPIACFRREVGSYPRPLESVEFARAAARVCFEPLLPHLHGMRELIVVPSGDMVGVPVEALECDGLVGERFTVSYTPSAGVFSSLRERAFARRRADGGPSCLVIDEVAETYREVRPCLPWAQCESRFVAGCHGPGSEANSSKAVSLEELVRQAEAGELRRFDVLHFAAHGRIDRHHPNCCALVLSEWNAPSALEAAIEGDRAYQGCITAGAIARGWKLDAGLVVLSACGSGLGRSVADEGYIGLGHAFFQAGARSLVVSLWEVEDEATALLMGRFYENRAGGGGRDGDGGGRGDGRGGGMEGGVGGRDARRGGCRVGDEVEEEGRGGGGGGMTTAEALREAKAWLRGVRTANGARTWGHPFFWAGFVVVE